MWDTLQLISPIFGLAFVGYLSGWSGLIDRDAIRGLNRFAFRVAVPVMLAGAMADMALSVEWELLASYYAGTLAVYVLGMAAGRVLFGQSLEKQAVFGFSSCFSNLVMVGIPLVVVAYGEEGELPLYMILSIHAPLLWTVGASLLGAGQGGGANGRDLPLAVLAAQARNPVVIGLAAGLAVNVTGIPIPGPARGIVDMLGATAAPCTLFTLGASLSGYRLRGSVREALGLVLAKNLLHPLLVYFLAFRVFSLTPTWAAVAVILAALPMGMNAYLFAEDSDLLAPTIAAAVILSTLTSVVSLPVVLYLLSP